MLVIRRRAGERLLIGDHIEIEVLEVTATRVKLGIVAPQEIPIIRKEMQTTREQNVAAAHALQPNAILSILRNITSVSSEVHQVLDALPFPEKTLESPVVTRDMNL